MNVTTIGNSTGSNWKRISTHFVAVAAGVAIALGSVTAFGPGTLTSAPVIPMREPSVQNVRRSTETPQQYVYIVNSETERGALLQEGASNVVVAGSDAARVLWAEGVREMSALGIPVTVMDMTTATARSRDAADADIMAGVLSTELANFAAPVERVAAPVDIMAGVISSERAAFGE